MINYNNILSNKPVKTPEDKSRNLLANGLMKFYQNNKDFIFNNWISLVKNNVKIQDKLEFEDLIQCKLTEDEFEEMKKHTIMGARTICKVISVNDLENGYLFMAIDIALYHHEKYDDSGYPYGLSGEQIPLSAKIFQIADAYDVITSKRPYKEPLNHEEAVRRIVSDSNKHFDPDIINVFVRIQDKFKKISDRYKNSQKSELN